MKGILKRLTLTALILATAIAASPSMAEGLYSGYAFINERHEELGDFDTWPLEEKAAFSEWQRELAEQGDKDAQYEISAVVYGVPGEDNMTLEEAVELARQGILAKYAVKAEVLLGKFKVEASYFTHFMDYEVPLWMIDFRVKDYDDMMDLGHYLVYIFDQTREMELYNAADSVG